MRLTRATQGREGRGRPLCSHLCHMHGTLLFVVWAGAHAVLQFESLNRVAPGDSIFDGNAVAHDDSGGLYAAGSITGSSSIDVFVIHWNASGGIEWDLRAGGSLEDRGRGIAPDGAGGAFVVGDFSGNISFGSSVLVSAGAGDIFVVRLKSSGMIVWALSAGGLYNDRGFGIAADGSGGAFVTGYFGGLAMFGSIPMMASGLSDAYVMRISGAGEVLWARQAGSASHCYGHSVASDGAGGALVMGSIEGQYNLNNVFALGIDGEGNVTLWAELGFARYRSGSGIVPDGA